MLLNTDDGSNFGGFLRRGKMRAVLAPWKWRKKKEEKFGENQPQKTIEGEDRISALPDCLLLEILCRLDHTDDVIKTRILSKRWKYIWTFVPTLVFKFPFSPSNYVPTLSCFFSSVHQTLTRRGQSKLKKFKLDTLYDDRFPSQVNNLIRYVISCNVEDLSIKLWGSDFEDKFMLDEYFYINSCITNLRIGGCVLNPIGAISWKTLRSLYIKHEKLSEDLIEKILLGSPVLETLKLSNCYGYTLLDITSKSVKNLVISGYMDPNGLVYMVEINAPNVLSLEIDQDLALMKFSLLDVSSLVKVDLDFTVDEDYAEEILEGIILSLRHVSEVDVGWFCFKVISCLAAKGFIHPSNLNVLDVTSSESSDDDSL